MGAAASILVQQDRLSTCDDDFFTWRLTDSPASLHPIVRVDPALPPLDDPDHIKLYELLFEPIAQIVMGKHAESIDKTAPLMCWAEIEEFKHEMVNELRMIRAVQIFDNFIKIDSPFRLETIPEFETERYSKLMTNLQECTIDASFFAELQHICFMEIYELIFLDLKQSGSLQGLYAELRSTYNKVKVDDFDYFEALGKGGFGSVYKARKKSTKSMYALKVMCKRHLLNIFAGEYSMVDLEVRVLAAIRHPFIVSMDYSFQTSDHVLIAMELAEGGTLAAIPDMFRLKVLQEHHVRFYVAEIVEALHYLHGIGLIYRDLKPGNVLISMDGHVKLADLGGVEDTSGDVLFNADHDVDESPKLCSVRTPPRFNLEYLTEPRRCQSFLGTAGYMSPEMVQLQSKRYHLAEGYTYMTDYWSLGVLVFVLLTGTLPFAPAGEEATPEDTLRVLTTCQRELPGEHTPACRDFIQQLLEVDQTERLGYGINGLEHIKSHPFFDDFDWRKVMRMTCKPPIIPSEMHGTSSAGAPRAGGFHSLPIITEAKNKISTVTAGEQQYFSKWDYVAPTTLRIEFGLANTERQYEDNPKLQKLVGDMSSTRNMSSLAHRFLSTASTAASTGIDQSSAAASPHRRAGCSLTNFPRIIDTVSI